MPNLITNNVTSDPENQQERLVEIGWIIGFVDGEGCFSTGIVLQNDRLGRKGYKLHYQVFYEFAVTQGAKSFSSLEKIRRFFGVGSVVINKRYDNHKEHLYRYIVRKKEDLLKVIIPFFQKYQLQSSKRRDFEKFVQIVNLVDHKRHLERDGLIEILKIAETMNTKKSRQDLIRILTHHT